MPTVSPRFTAPLNGGTLAALSTPVTWAIDAGSQLRYRLSLLTVGGTLIRSTDILLGTSTTYTLPLSWTPATQSTYRLRLEVWEDWGDPVVREVTFSWSFTALAELENLTVYDDQLAQDLEPSTPRLDWDYPTISLSQFAGYIVRRRPTSGSASDDVVIAHITDYGQNSWYDIAAPCNVPMTYTVTYLRKVSGVVTSSASAEIQHTSMLRVPIVASAANGLTLRFPLAVMGVSVSGSSARRDDTVYTWGGRGRATVVAAPSGYGQRTLDATFNVYAWDTVPAYERKALIEQTVLSGDPLIVRMEHERWWARVSDWNWERRELVGSLTVSVSLEEIALTEGVEVTV
jgi:hypothetical protein